MNNAGNFFGVAMFQPKKQQNTGSLFRTAHLMGASYLATIGRRYQRQSSDTTNATKHIPTFHYLTFGEFITNLPLDVLVVCVEQNERSISLINYRHPERVIYLLGSEDNGIPSSIMMDHDIVEIPSKHCLNVAVAGSIVLYDRIAKGVTKWNQNLPWVES